MFSSDEALETAKEPTLSSLNIPTKKSLSILRYNQNKKVVKK